MLDFIIVDKVPQGKEIGIENATVTGTACTGLVADMSLVGVFYAVASGSQLRQRTQMRA
ncbi:hypothetical protein LOK49_LG03G01669 [Camellia lanceoleosa]|uniref:Uncharacterized protein n=1 Tax=Camellia lanceoleosa TaxID=1840588 RepID=A0ACC0ICL1_9ERIC|nr:hypothetical protein LOK49_LG03G01669 [Camellia lanceoleosa]